jgi:hypothetical protein
MLKWQCLLSLVFDKKNGRLGAYGLDNFGGTLCPLAALYNTDKKVNGCIHSS